MTVETLHPHKSRVGAGGLPHLGHDLRRPRARVAMHRRRLQSGWEHMWDPAGGVGVGSCHTMVMIFADREPEWRCNAAACGAVGSTYGIRLEEWK
ncbi:hypothetical protein S83_031884 [Arachis hypogaea]